MYVCICNALNDRKVSSALAGGAASVSDVFRHHGCAPRCGSCVNHIRAQVGAASQSQDDVPGDPGFLIAAD
jgi:bacterioferritin-associated ferredoxin